MITCFGQGIHALLSEERFQEADKRLGEPDNTDVILFHRLAWNQTNNDQNSSVLDA